MINIPGQLHLDNTQLQIFRAHPAAKLPTKGTPESAAWDLYTVEAGELYAEDTKGFSTGLIMRPPEGYHIKVWGRSGWGLRYGIGIPHGMGLVDRDFCGPDDVMKVVLHRSCGNGSTHKEHFKPLPIEVGDRIAQMTIEKTNIFDFVEIKQPPRQESRGGFGSTGVK